MFPCHSADIKGSQVPISDLQKVGTGHDYLVGSKPWSWFPQGESLGILLNWPRDDVTIRKPIKGSWATSQKSGQVTQNLPVPRDTSGWSQMTAIYLVSFLLLQPHPAQDSHKHRFHHLYPVILYFSWPQYSYLLNGMVLFRTQRVLHAMSIKC